MKKWIWIALALPVILTGCDLFHRDFSPASDDPSKGSLVMILDGGTLPTKTIAPALGMDVAEYRLRFYLKSGVVYNFQFQAQAGINGLYTKPQMETGDWQAEITAYNSDLPTPTLIGAYLGSSTARFSFSIAGGSMTTQSVAVIPLIGSGSGSINLTVQWLDTVGVAEGLTATLGGSPITFVETSLPAATTRVFNYAAGSRAAGYHILTLRLLDGGTLIWGWMEAVRILADQPTAGTFDLTGSLAGAGGLTLNLSMENPVAVLFNRSDGFIVTKGSTTLVDVVATATPAAPVGSPYTYSWYLDGVQVPGATDATFDINPADPTLTLGNHNLSVLVDSGVPYSSKTVSFVVQ